MCRSIEYYRRHKSVLIKDASLIFFHSRYFCELDRRPASGMPKLGFIPLAKAVYGWPFKLGSPFVPSINKNLKWILSGE